MFFIFTAFFAVASGFASADELCFERISEVCPFDHENAPRRFPTTVEGLKKACDFLTKLIDCGISYEERCHTMPEILPAAYKVRATVNDVCNPDSPLHAAVVDNLECFFDTMRNEGRSCFEEVPEREFLDKQARELLKEGFEAIDDDSEDESAYKCLRDLNTIACQGSIVEQKCGTVAKDAFVEIIQRSTPFVDICNEQTIKMLPSVIRLRELENEIKEALKRRRK